MARQYFELIEGAHSKYWHIEVSGKSLLTHYGRIGRQGQTTSKSFAAQDLVKGAAEKLISQKLRKGYRKVTARTAAKHVSSPASRKSAPKKRSVRESWDIIERVLGEHAPRSLAALGKPATKTQITRLESKLGKRLPKGFVQSLLIHNGMPLGADRLFNHEALLSTTNLFKTWKMMKTLLEEGHFDEECCGEGRPVSRWEKPDSRRIKPVHWSTGWIQFTDNEGDGYILDLDPRDRKHKGQVFYFRTWGGVPRRIIASNYDDWLAKVAGRFRRKRFTVDDGYIELDPFR